MYGKHKVALTTTTRAPFAAADDDEEEESQRSGMKASGSAKLAGLRLIKFDVGASLSTPSGKLTYRDTRSLQIDAGPRSSEPSPEIPPKGSQGVSHTVRLKQLTEPTTPSLVILGTLRKIGEGKGRPPNHIVRDETLKGSGLGIRHCEPWSPNYTAVFHLDSNPSSERTA
ncbi:uncharacterized protein P884DRAFT_265628 [Thermothelomyces heterothallicus CBS 202.75]|uniref:uncharacterized protein n=1 Tax=Thermothelomyces heterothallicus CBS 202.75 TaxID=1149848 RepID=UPI003743801F